MALDSNRKVTQNKISGVEGYGIYIPGYNCNLTSFKTIYDQNFHENSI